MFLFKKKISVPEGFKGDLIPSPKDDRDYALSSVSPIIQRYPEVCPAPFDSTISNQGNIPSCVGHSLSGIKQYLELKEKISKDFDGDWLYYECKKIDGYPDLRGTYLRVGLEVLRKTGVKPIGETDPSPYKIETYVRNDDGSFEGIKKAIFLYGMVLAGFTGSNPGWQGEIVRAPQTGETTWGHAIRLVAYEKNYLIGQNSWGEQAHNKGWFKIPSSYLPFESWVIVLDRPTTLAPQPIKTGWAAVNYIQLLNGIWKTIANLNVRSEAGTGYPILKTLIKGSVVQLTNSPRKSNNGFVWAEIII